MPPSSPLTDFNSPSLGILRPTQSNVCTPISSCGSCLPISAAAAILAALRLKGEVYAFVAWLTSGRYDVQAGIGVGFFSRGLIELAIVNCYLKSWSLKLGPGFTHNNHSLDENAFFELKSI